MLKFEEEAYRANLRSIVLGRQAMGTRDRYVNVG